MGAMTTDTALPAFTLSDRLTKAREHAGLSQEQMAAAMGIGRRSIVRYESGKIPPRPAVIAWASITGVPLWWLDDAERPNLLVTNDKPGATVTRGKPTTQRAA